MEEEDDDEEALGAVAVTTEEVVNRLVVPEFWLSFVDCVLVDDKNDVEREVINDDEFTEVVKELVAVEGNFPERMSPDTTAAPTMRMITNATGIVEIAFL